MKPKIPERTTANLIASIECVHFDKDGNVISKEVSELPIKKQEEQ